MGRMVNRDFFTSSALAADLEGLEGKEFCSCDASVAALASFAPPDPVSRFGDEDDTCSVGK
jgi:hypothetical protein